MIWAITAILPAEAEGPALRRTTCDRNVNEPFDKEFLFVILHTSADLDEAYEI